MLTGQSLATFSLVDCCQSLLGETLEVLSPTALFRLWDQARGQAPPQPPATPGASRTLLGRSQAGGVGGGVIGAGSGSGGGMAPAAAAAVAGAGVARLVSYIVRRVDVVVRLLARLATLPEALEMARVTGLTLPQVGPACRISARSAVTTYICMTSGLCVCDTFSGIAGEARARVCMCGLQ